MGNVPSYRLLRTFISCRVMPPRTSSYVCRGEAAKPRARPSDQIKKGGERHHLASAPPTFTVATGDRPGRGAIRMRMLNRIVTRTGDEVSHAVSRGLNLTTRQSFRNYGCHFKFSAVKVHDSITSRCKMPVFTLDRLRGSLPEAYGACKTQEHCCDGNVAWRCQKTRPLSSATSSKCRWLHRHQAIL
jgi:hypothetical protein